MKAKMKIKTGDTVMVIAGKEKTKQGKVLAVDRTNHKVKVEGANIVTRHQKPRSAQDKGGLIKKEAFMDVSNVMVVCPSCKKPSRVGYKGIGKDKMRFCKKCGKVLGSKNSAVSVKTTKTDKPEDKETSKAKASAPVKEGGAKQTKAPTAKTEVQKTVETEKKAAAPKGVQSKVQGQMGKKPAVKTK